MKTYSQVTNMAQTTASNETTQAQEKDASPAQAQAQETTQAQVPARKSRRTAEKMIKTLEFETLGREFFTVNIGIADNDTEKKIRRHLYRAFLKAEKMALGLGTKDAHTLAYPYAVTTLGTIGKNEPFILSENDSTEFVSDDSDD